MNLEDSSYNIYTSSKILGLDLCFCFLLELNPNDEEDLCKKLAEIAKHHWHGKLEKIIIFLKFIKKIIQFLFDLKKFENRFERRYILKGSIFDLTN